MSFDALGSFPLGGFADVTIQVGAHYIYVVLPEDRVYLILVDIEIETIFLVPEENRISVIPFELVETIVDRTALIPVESRMYEVEHD